MEQDYIAKAHAKYIRISPYKVRPVIDLIRGKDVSEAVTILKFSSKRKASHIVEKVLNSAVANAENKFPNIEIDKLYVKEVYANDAPRLKRFRAGAMGRVKPITKRLSHISIFLDEK